MTPDIKALFIDLDGTLLNSDLSISLKNKQAIRTLQDEAIHIFIASGRPFSSIASWIRELELHNLVITLNGAAILDLESGALVDCVGLKPSTVRRIDEIANEQGVTATYYSAMQWYVSKIDRWSEIEIQRSGVQPQVFATGREPQTIVKALLIGERRLLEVCKLEFESSIASHAQWFFTYPEYLEVIHTQASKGRGRDKIVSQLGLQLHETMAIGDGENDIPLFRDIGISVAMKNASNRVKTAAHIVAPSNDDDGVATAIRGLLLGDLVERANMQFNNSNPVNPKS